MNGGAGGKDDIRGNFEDSVHFETIKTDKNGYGKIEFTLPDNITKYRITAHAANKDVFLGTNSKKIISKLDFFMQFVEPRGLKTSDDVVLNSVGIADFASEVDYTFEIKELNKTMNTKAKINEIAKVNFGKLPFGTYTARITGKTKDYEDIVEYKFDVKETTQEISQKTTINVNSNTKINPSKNPIVLEIYNSNIEEYLKYIDFMERTNTTRLDTQIAYNRAQMLKNKYYNEKNSLNTINFDLYKNDGYYSNLIMSNDDLVLTALINYFEGDNNNGLKLRENDNLFEYYLCLSANKKEVLNDLLYLKQENEIDNYNKLLLTLSFIFQGDYQNAKEIYNTINYEEDATSKSISALIDTFINKKEAERKIDELIKNDPANEYLRFAIISYFENSSKEIGEEEKVKIKYGDKEEVVSLNKIEVKKLVLNNSELNNIKFETESQNIMVSYYYQTSIENLEEVNKVQDIKLSGNGKFIEGESVKILIEFENEVEGEVRIALPNSLRLDKSDNTYDFYDFYEKRYYIQSNNIDYITICKAKDCKYIELPFLVINPGSYKFENIICKEENLNIYHISNSLSCQ